MTLISKISAVKITEITGGEWLGQPPDSFETVDYFSTKNSSRSLIIFDQKKHSLEDLATFIQKYKYENCALMHDFNDFPLSADIPLLKVKYTWHAIQKISHYCRSLYKGKVVMVTGSCGKTSTKEIISNLFSTQLIVSRTKNSANSLHAIVYKICNLPSDTQCFVAESGLASSGSSISFMSSLLRPDIAIITNISAAHLQGYKSINEIMHKKLDIVIGLKQNGVVILDGDSALIEDMKNLVNKLSTANIVTVGFSDNCDVQVKNYYFDKTSCSGKVKLYDQIYNVSIPLRGKHWLRIVATTMICGRFLKLDLEKILDKAKSLMPMAGRGFIHGTIGEKVSIYDSHYNANPASMISELHSYSDISRLYEVKKIAIIGSMLELGENSLQFHLSLIPYLKNIDFKHIYFIGNETKKLHDEMLSHIPSTYYESVLDLNEKLDLGLFENSFVFIKGSNAIQLNKVVNKLKCIYDLM